MDNLELYNRYRDVPDNAKKTIGGGRLKGMTDINPMWRIKALTEAFGPAGTGWGYEIINKELINGANGEVAAMVDITLWYKTEDGVGKIPASGGSMFVTKETGGLRTDDECYKKALTDALSVACKALGIGADVYWASDRTKYSNPSGPEPQPMNFMCSKCGKPVKGYKGRDGKVVSAEEHIEYTKKQFGQTLCLTCAKQAAKQQAAGGAE